jgi:hypothetical protein
VKIGCLVESFSATSDFGGDSNKVNLYYFSHNSLMNYAVQETINSIVKLEGINHDDFAHGIRQAAEVYFNESIVFSHIFASAVEGEIFFKYRDL